MDAVFRFGMDYRYRKTLQQPQGHESFLLVPKAVIFKGKRGVVEYSLGIHKIQPVVLQVPPALNLIPSEPNKQVYIRSVYTSRLSNLLPSTQS